jgi:L-seryl-tRNA(Ser) seleniumtransferase
LPQVDAVLAARELAGALSTYRRDVIKRLIQAELAELREQIGKGKRKGAPGVDEVGRAVSNQLVRLTAPPLTRVVNATGIVLHTNLGRAVLREHAQRAVTAVAGAYSNLEYDLLRGKRTKRDVTLEPLLKALTGCESATVVNNNAAAVFLALRTLAQRREVITSRGELVEIGGSYRVPDVVRASGCKLVEVGTTNRTRLSDYEGALSSKTGLLLKTHTSNYRIRGFTEEVELDQLVALGRRHDIPVMLDLGSGYLAPEDGPRLAEPDIARMLAADPDLLSFSGDKLLGGPQAGIILGRRTIIRKLRQSPLWRVLRIDKFTVSALGATLATHLGRHPAPLPSEMRLDELEQIAQDLKTELCRAKPGWDFDVADGTGSYGGGSLPDETMPSKLVTIAAPELSADKLDQLLRRGKPPIVGYMRKGTYALNVLTLLPGDAERIVARFKELADD